MPILRALSWIYLVLCVGVGIATLPMGEVAVTTLWVGVGVLALIFDSAVSNPNRVGRFVAAAIASAIFAASMLMVAAAPLGLWNELSGPGESTFEPVMLVATAIAFVIFGWTTRALFRLLDGPTRRRGLIVALTLPTVATILCAVSGALCLPFTPPGFLNGLLAGVAVFWAALAAAFLAGGWLAALMTRIAEPPTAPPPSLPHAKLRTR